VHNVTDEFIPPAQLSEQGIIHNGDGVIFCNVRPDRARELTACFVKEHFSEFVVKPLNLVFFITPVEYDIHLPTTVLFPRPIIQNTLKDVLAEHGKTIFSIAETEKYAHVTYFFRGENEEAVVTETREMVSSSNVESFAQNPEMSAAFITQEVISSLDDDPKDFYLINYANADMVGHSGNFGATIQAIEFLDKQLGTLYEVIVEKMNGTLYITADHGKAEDMFDEVAKQPRTSHTNNPVPFIVIQKGLDSSDLPLTQLSDIAPFILKNMGIDVPVEMTK
jgi:2,3-bisphosphoglycerate-independent phosphoglycerate mutase